MMSEMVNHPAHYVSASGVECIQIVRSLPYTLGNCVKYIWRIRDKWNPLEDIEKAQFYFNDFVDNLPLVSGEDSWAAFLHCSKNYHIYHLIKQHSEWLRSQGRLAEAEFFTALDYLLDTVPADAELSVLKLHRLQVSIDKIKSELLQQSKDQQSNGK